MIKCDSMCRKCWWRAKSKGIIKNGIERGAGFFRDRVGDRTKNYLDIIRKYNEHEDELIKEQSKITEEIILWEP